MFVCVALSHDNDIGYQLCAPKNTPNLKDFLPYSKQILMKWKEVAVQLEISTDDIVIIDEKSNIEDKCFYMLVKWLQGSKSPCWCHFVKALIEVKLDTVAEEAIANLHLHLKTCHHEGSTSLILNVE